MNVNQMEKIKVAEGAPLGNQHAKKEGIGLYVRVRVPDSMVASAVNAMSPEERGAILAAHVYQTASQSLAVVADCSRCGEPINATEPELVLDGVRICESCYAIARAAL